MKEADRVTLRQEWRRHFLRTMDEKYPLPDPWWRHPFRYLSTSAMRKRLVAQFEATPWL